MATNLGDAHVAAIGYALTDCPHVTILNLSNNLIRDSGAKALAKVNLPIPSRLIAIVFGKRLHKQELV